jgi:L-aminopeptidase/D-esterase-like protein
VKLPSGPRDDLSDVAGIRVGHAEVPGGGSGCTVVLGPFRARVEVAGLAGGSREFVTLDPAHVTGRVDALVLTGGSAYGLAVADGVMAWLEGRGQGFRVSHGVVPIVPAAVIYDLAPGRGRPGPEEGRAACEDAERGAVDGAAGATGDATRTNRSGAGAGARVGTLLGPKHAMPGGVGTASVRAGGWTVAALAVVNAVGSVVDAQGRVLAGPRPDPDGPPVDALADLFDALGASANPSADDGPRAGENTTLCVVATDAPLADPDLVRVLRLAGTALPRRINPVFTPFDGDVIFGVVPPGPETPSDPAGEPRPPAETLLLGVAARAALERAIERAVA